MGHVQNSCPNAKKVPQRKNKTRSKPKGWKFPQNFLDEEEDDEEMDPPTNEEAQNTQGDVENGSINHEFSGTPKNTTRQEMIPVAMETKDSKFHHVSESLDLDKENQRLNEGTHLVLIMATPS